MFLHNLLSLGVDTSSAEGGVGLPVTTLSADVTVGTGPILEKMKPSKQAWSDPFLPRMKEKVGSESAVVDGSSKSER